MAVKVQFEIGHTSKLRAKKTAEGFTHDWELYVKGVGRAEISIFVEKVVFTLHASFAKPKRAIKDPPYMIQESGYAGFILPIDIYFRNREEPKRVQFTYDLDLQQTGPPHHRFEVKKFIFENPSDEFRQKLIKGGGVPVAGVVSRNVLPAIKPANIALTDIDPRTTMTMVESALASKQKLSADAKKHKPRHKEESKNNSFANLFGPPIKTNISEAKQLNENTVSRSENASLGDKFSKEKEYAEKSREKNDMSKLAMQKAMFNKLKSAPGSNGKSEKSSESEKSKHKAHDKERMKRDKLESGTGSANLPKQAHSPMKSDGGRGEDGKKEQSDKKSKKEKKDKDRKREENIDRRSSAENQTYATHSNDKLLTTTNTASPLQKAGSGSDVRSNDLNEKKMVSHKEKKVENSTQANKAGSREEKSHKYKKKVKSKDVDREKSHERMKKAVKKSSSSKDVSSHKANYIVDAQTEAATKAQVAEYTARAHEKAQRKEKPSKMRSSSKSGNLDENKKSDSSSLDKMNGEKMDKYENMSAYQNNTQSNHSSSLSAGLPVSEESSCSSFQEASAKYFNRKSKDARSSSTSHRNQTGESAEREDRKRVLANNENSTKLNFLEPPTKQAKREQNTKSPECHSSLPQTNLPISKLNSLAPEYINELQELHKKIISLQDDNLQQVVELIASTGCYEITTKTFDFDLCRLNQNVVQRLQELLSNTA